MSATTRRRKWWGWGYEDDGIERSRYELLRSALLHGLGDPPSRRVHVIDPDSIDLPPPRFAPPPAIAAFATDDRLDRLGHAFGKAYVDLMRAVRGDVANPPDWVAYPRDEADIAKVVALAEAEGIALIPYGGGSSVVGGVEPPPRGTVPGVVTLDLRHLDRILAVEPISRLAEVEAGMFGPALEDGLRPTA